MYAFPQREPIKLPKQVEQPKATVQPDVIPVQAEPQISVPPPAAFKSITPEPNVVEQAQEEQIYANVPDTKTIPAAVVEEAPPSPKVAPIVHAQTVQPSSPEPNVEPIAQNTVEEPHSLEQGDPIYQNQEDLSEYIEDTGVKATALYDYQAAADDEISFDPDDLITHIEQVCLFELLYSL